MITDNSKEIRSLLDFKNPDDFYWIQVIRRGKDHPDLPATNLSIHSFYIRSENDFERYAPMAKTMADAFGARAYFYPQRKSYGKVMLMELSEIAQRICKGNTLSGHRIFNHCAAKASEETVWVIDLDGISIAQVMDIRKFIWGECSKAEEDVIIKTLPTIGGFHMLTRKFNRKIFQEKYPNFEIKLDGPTLLYANTETFKAKTTC